MSTSASSCPSCHKKFDAEKMIPIVFSCGHGVCTECNDKTKSKVRNCPTCGKGIVTWAKNFAFIETLKTFAKVQKRIDELKNPNFNHQCPKCQKWTLEKNMHICKTCIIDKDLLDLTKIAEEERAKKVVEVSMCSNCIVPLHSYKAHTLVTMLPIYNAQCFAPNISMLESKWDEFKKSLNSMHVTYLLVFMPSRKVHKTYNMMTDIAKRTEIPNQKKKILKKRSNFIKEFIEIYVEAESDMNFRTMEIETETGSSSSKSPKFESKLDEFENKVDLFKDTFFAQREAFTKEGGEKYNVLIEMARKCKSKVEQNDVFVEMEKFIREKVSIHEEIRALWQDRNKEIDENLKEINEWCEARKENCADE